MSTNWTPLILADRTALSFEQVLAMIPDLDPGAFAPAAVAPAAGAPAPGSSTAGFGIDEEFDGTGFDGGRDFQAVLGNTFLTSHLLEFFVELPGQPGRPFIVIE